MLLLMIGLAGGYILAVLQNAGKLKSFPVVDKSLGWVSGKILSAVNAMTGPGGPTP